jgi:exonuclease VII large subunit
MGKFILLTGWSLVLLAGVRAGEAADAVVPADDPAALEAAVGSEVTVEGVVRSVGQTPDGGVTFLNFGERHTGFVAVVFRPSYDKFPGGFERYAGRKVRIRGALEKYRDRQLQIKVFNPGQIEAVGDGPED